MSKNIWLFVFITVIVVGGVGYWFLRNGNGSLPGDEIVLYFGEGCPHCAVVDEFIEQNGIEEKVSFVKKEVFNNDENASELTQVARKCELAAADIGVPFLWDGSECFVGDTDIIDFFKQKAGISR